MFCFCIVALLLSIVQGVVNSSGHQHQTLERDTDRASYNYNHAQAANASVSVVPSVSTVAPGGNFDVSIQVTTDAPTRGLQCALTWDPTKVECNSVEQGSFFTSFAQQNNLSVQLMPSSLSADNKIGKFPPGNDVQGTIQYNQAVFLMGGTEASDNTFPGPEGTGDVFILHMTALPDASGTVNFTLANVELSDNAEMASALNPTVNNGQITISGANSLKVMGHKFFIRNGKTYERDFSL